MFAKCTCKSLQILSRLPDLEKQILFPTILAKLKTFMACQCYLQEMKSRHVNNTLFLLLHKTEWNENISAKANETLGAIFVQVIVIKFNFFKACLNLVKLFFKTLH